MTKPLGPPEHTMGVGALCLEFVADPDAALARCKGRVLRLDGPSYLAGTDNQGQTAMIFAALDPPVIVRCGFSTVLKEMMAYRGKPLTFDGVVTGYQKGPDGTLSISLESCQLAPPAGG